MSSAPKSRWTEDDAQTREYLEQKKREKDEKKRAKAEKQRELEAARAEKQPVPSIPTDANVAEESKQGEADTTEERPTKRRRLSNERSDEIASALLRIPGSEWGPCRHVDNYQRLNAIEEGSYGWVSRAKEVTSGDIVAIKKLKMENQYDGFPITGLREIQTLQEARHPHIVKLREVVMGDTMDDVFLVMDFLEHDLKTLLEDIREPFLPSETKTLLLQLLSATDFLHSHWIMHRDLKTSNLLMNNRGEIKLADFGMARYFSDPPPPRLTQLVVTLWYRSPELILGAKKYGPEIDMWSIGCIFGELLTKEPLFQGNNEVSQLSVIFKLTGPPNSNIWPGFRSLPHAKSLRLPPSPPKGSVAAPLLPRSRFSYLSSAGLELLSSLLSLNPASRPTAKTCLSHPYFTEHPKPKAKQLFPTFPSKAGMEKRRRRHTPEAPKRGEEAPAMDFANVFGGGGAESGSEAGAGSALRLG